MKSTTTTTMLAAAAAFLLAAPPAGAKWVHFFDSIFEAPADSTLKHPERLFRAMNLPTEAAGDLVQICIGYVNDVEKNDRGKVTATVNLIDPDGGETTVELGGGVRNGAYGECKEVDPMPAGTIVEFDFRMRKFARLRDGDRFQIAGAVAIDGNPFQRQATPLSIADQDAVQKIVDWVGSGRGVALRRENSGWTVDWRLPGQSFELGRTFRTIAEAVAEWCKRIE